MEEKQISINIFCADKYRLTNWESEGTYRAVNALYYIIEGTADIEINKNDYHLKKGDLMLCPISSFTRYKKTSEVFHKYCIHFHLSHNKIPAFAEYEFEYVTRPENEEELMSVLDALSEGHKYKNLYNDFEYWNKLSKILEIFFKSTKAVKKELSKSEYKAWKTMEYMTRNYSKKLSHESLAEYAGVHLKHLSKIFKATFNESINFYLNFIKIERITSVMAYRNVLLKELAGIGEYSNYSTMKKWFYHLRGFDIKEFKSEHISDKHPVAEKYDAYLYLTVQNALKSKNVLLLENADSIIYLNKGKIRFDSINLEEKEILFVSKNNVKNITQSENCEITQICINTNILLTDKKIKKLRSNDCISAFFENLFQEKNCLEEIFARENSLFNILFEINGGTKKELLTDNFFEIYDYIDENIKNSLTCKSVAEHFSSDTKAFSNHFYDTTGISLFEYIEDVKYKKAVELIKNKNMPIKDIASEIGFSSYEGFRRFLKRKTGSFPGELRNKL